MRRAAILLACLLVAVATGAQTSYFLDRSGVLWKGSSSDEGLVLTGERDGQVITRSSVPFVLGFAVNQDVAIQVAADEVTGKVAVVWQRNWTSDASEIILAVWSGGSWERIEHLSQDLTANPRNPSIRLTAVATLVPDPNNPNDPTKATTVRDSFLHVAWWEGTDQSHGTYALLQLTADPSDTSALIEQNLDTFATIGLACGQPVPPTVLEHPLFASVDATNRAQLLFGSQQLCIFQVLEIHFTLDTSGPTGSGGIPAIAQRRRHTPIFGVTAAFPMARDMSMDGTRVILGANLNPVAYRVVDGGTVLYVTFSNGQWSPVRTLAVSSALTMDQAIPLVENLAR